ncbi:MAG: glycine cleavage T C-terminal barrel domain-containing protein [Pyrinomonadaceae bacterium]
MNSNFKKEYEAVRESGAGILEFPNRGLIEVSGSEAVQFLNGLITNDVKKLEDGSWMLAAFPNAQGRLLAMVRVLRIEDKFLFDVEAENYQKVLQNLMRFTFAGDFKVNDLTDQMRLLAVNGKQAFETVNYNLQVPDALDTIAVTDVNNEQVIVIRATHTAEKGFDLFVPHVIYENVKADLRTRGAIEISDEAREVLRIEAGIPKYGVDMDEMTVVLETGLDEAVSFTKGCYIGQEIIARIHFRGHVAKKVSGLILDENIEITPGDALVSTTGKAAGRITSTVFSPKLNKRIALGLVRYEFLASGTELFVRHGENQFTTKVAELPFVR